ncbi:MAG: phosphate acyltransferase PlsX [Holosporaceae bacterium]|jgi:glycerol-3-phosphate acyltransferase PlsX|nr:phosphate acyltransferase PlsX [Holosporaceae bacterium]
MIVTNQKKIIAVDGMGGDYAPKAVFNGLARFCCCSDLHFIIFGNKEILEKHMSLLPKDLSYEIRHTDVIVTPDMEVISALRTGKKSSMGMAIQAVQSKEANAVVSSGNTGLYMALSKIILGTIEGIERPAIASVIPTKNTNTVCIDLGANAESDVKNLVDFAIMGEALARSVFNKENIKLALLNIGSEDSKGSRLIKKTSEILKKLFDNYVGFVEGDYIFKANVDVIVTDGFTGNVSLKTIEGTANYIVSELKNAFSCSLFAKIGALLASSALIQLKKKIDPRLYNGAILVGLNGVVVKSHGGSDDIGFSNAVKFTINILKNNIFDRIREQLEKSKLHYILSDYCEGKLQ